MDRSLRETMLRGGAVINGASRRALHFGEPAAELRAALEDCVLADRSTWTRLIGDGPDLAGLLNRLSTNKVDALAAGDGAATVLTTSKGRIVERLFVHRIGDPDLLLVAGPGREAPVLEHLARYTFAERTGLADRTETTCQLALLGPRAEEALRAAGFEPPGRHRSREASFEGGMLHVLGEDGWTADGFSVFGPAAQGASLWQTLNLAVSRCGGRPAGLEALDAWRILRGVGAAGHELTEDYNPLEAGLREAVSFAKGCYVGQEVVARLNTYDKISRELVGFRLPAGAAVPSPGTSLWFQDAEVGRITSAAQPPSDDRPIALGYLKRRVAETGLEVTLGAAVASATARMVRLPFGDA